MDLATFKSKLAAYQEKFEDYDEDDEDCEAPNADIGEIIECEYLEELQTILGTQEVEYVTSGRYLEEGEADVQSIILKVGDKYFRLDGSYCSWGGGEYDDCVEDWYEVIPTTKTITIYEPK